MDMSMTSMASMTMGTQTGASALPASTNAPEGGSMDMMGGCQISMLWNWYTVDACFISETWRITSPGMFAGSCIGVILLVMSLAFLRKVHRRYDAHVIRSLAPIASLAVNENSSDDNSGRNSPAKKTGVSSSAHPLRFVRSIQGPARRRPTIVQQIIRSLLHMVEFGVAYFIMLMAMYYNGYIIICILIGAFLGYFVFEWEATDVGSSHAAVTTGATEVTGCCG